MNNENELLPCPFCGQRGAKVMPHEDTEFYIVECYDCSAKSDWGYEQGDAIDSWNMRSSQESIEYERGFLAAKKMMLDILQQEVKADVSRET